MKRDDLQDKKYVQMMGDWDCKREQINVWTKQRALHMQLNGNVIYIEVKKKKKKHNLTVIHKLLKPFNLLGMFVKSKYKVHVHLLP